VVVEIGPPAALGTQAAMLTGALVRAVAQWVIAPVRT
jgi:hypothetical protein